MKRLLLVFAHVLGQVAFIVGIVWLLNQFFWPASLVLLIGGLFTYGYTYVILREPPCP